MLNGCWCRSGSKKPFSGRAPPCRQGSADKLFCYVLLWFACSSPSLVPPKVPEDLKIKHSDTLQVGGPCGRLGWCHSLFFAGKNFVQVNWAVYMSVQPFIFLKRTYFHKKIKIIDVFWFCKGESRQAKARTPLNRPSNQPYPLRATTIL